MFKHASDKTYVDIPDALACSMRCVGTFVHPHFSLLHPLNASFEIVSSDSGKTILVSEEQSSNALYPIVCRAPFGIITSRND